MITNLHQLLLDRLQHQDTSPDEAPALLRDLLKILELTQRRQVRNFNCWDVLA